MTAELDLGTLTLESTAADTRIDLATTARLAPSDKDEIDQLELQLTAYKLSHEDKDLPFIWIGAGLDLSVIVQLPQREEGHWRDEVFEELPLRLQRMAVV